MIGTAYELVGNNVKEYRNTVRYIRASSAPLALALAVASYGSRNVTIADTMPDYAGQDIGSAHAYDKIASPTAGEYVTAIETRGIKHTPAYTARQESWAFKNAEKGKDAAIGRLCRMFKIDKHTAGIIVSGS